MIEFLRIRDVKQPNRNEGSAGVVDAGIDLYIPNYSNEFAKELQTLNPDGFTCYYDSYNKESIINIKEGTVFKIPLGVKFKFPKDIVMKAGNKSGVCTKQFIVYGADTIDASYQGEWIFNGIALKDTHIQFGQKIIQFIPIKINTDSVEECTDAKNFFQEETLRGSGGFGSTGV